MCYTRPSQAGHARLQGAAADGCGGPGGQGQGQCSLGPFARGAGGLPPPARGRLQPLRNVCAGPRVHFLVSEPLRGPARPPLPRAAPRRLPRWGLGLSIAGTAPAAYPATPDPAESSRPNRTEPCRRCTDHTHAGSYVSPASGPRSRGAGLETNTRSSKNATRRVSEAQAQLRPSAGGGLHPTATFDEGSHGVRASLGQSEAAEPGPPKVVAIPEPGRALEKATSHKSRGRKFSVGSQ